MIELQPFEKSDFDRLIGWVKDARLFLQWTGPTFQYPLDHDQLAEYLTECQGPEPKHVAWKAVDSTSGQVIGHIAINSIDREKKSGKLHNVLIGEADGRGKGLGQELVSCALALGFEKLHLEEITLAGIDFNTPAIRCYEAAGFVRYDFKRSDLAFENENWNVIFMALTRQNWAKSQ